ncbi:hypothetical protein [Dysgonomonas sp.]
MSGIQEIVIIEPPVGMSYPSGRVEHLESQIHRCPVCNGYGGKYIDSRSYNYDLEKGDRYEPCVMCKGSGTIQANITHEWIAVGEIKDQFKTE